MNRLEAIQFLESFFSRLNEAAAGRRPADLKAFQELLISLKHDISLSIPLLRELAALGLSRESARAKGEGILRGRMNRRYLRLCRVQEELTRLDFKKADPSGKNSGLARNFAQNFALEDYVFSQIDFSRYREIEARYFETLFLEGLADFDVSFYNKAFGRSMDEIQSLIKESYKKTEGFYKIQKDNPLILSVMRSLETSLEDLPLLGREEIQKELENLIAYVEGEKSRGRIRTQPDKFYALLVSSLDAVQITHEDGMTTKLFMSKEGDLSGTFRPGDKPWTRVLIGIREQVTGNR